MILIVPVTINNMTVKELQELLSKQDPNEDIYLWNGNWPTEHYSTRLKLHRYSSATDTSGKIIDNPLILSSYSRPEFTQ